MPSQTTKVENHRLRGIGVDRRDCHATALEACEIAKGNHDLTTHELLNAIAQPIRLSAKEGLNTDRMVSSSNKSHGYESMLEELVRSGMPRWLRNCRWEIRQDKEPPWEVLGVGNRLPSRHIQSRQESPRFTTMGSHT